jgi:uncharacterized protein (TIGR03435 family)
MKPGPIAAAAFLSWLAYAQVAGPQFEVATIKPSPPPGPYGYSSIGCSGGPGTDDPERVRCVNMSLSSLVSVAYELRMNELVAPAWMENEKFDITAKVPAGTTKAQFHLMQQDLLAERFKLAVHRDQKEMPAYELVVLKGGPKFKEAVDRSNEPAPPEPAGKFKTNKEGFPEIPAGVSMLAMIAGGKTRMNGAAQTMDEFCRRLSPYARRTIVDATGLKGKYDYSVYWVADSLRAGSNEEPDGPDLLSALQSQLGLKLEPKKLVLPVLVVDHAEKSPTEN